MVEQSIAYEGPIVTRRDAAAVGDTRYFTGEPCKQGHLAQRWVASYTCDECQRIDSAWRNANNIYGIRDKSRFHQAKNYNKNREKKLAAYVKARLNPKNVERSRIASKVWRAKNREHTNLQARLRHANLTEQQKESQRAYVRNRRSRRRNNGGTHTGKDIKRLYDRQKGKCAACVVSLATGYHVDHIMPLIRGGSNAPRNLQLLCSRCNQSKAAKHPINWAQERGLLL